MTNKLPVVGKRYKYAGHTYKCSYDNGALKFRFECELDSSRDMVFSKHEIEYSNHFWRHFKELPETNTPPHIPDIRKKEGSLSKEVLEAMEELRELVNLKEDLTLYPNYEKEKIEKLDNYFWRLLGKSQNLLNALDNQFKPNVRDKEDSLSDIDTQIKKNLEDPTITCADCEKEIGEFRDGVARYNLNHDCVKPKEPIWKPASELPYDKWSIIKERGEVYLTRKESDIYDVFYDKQAIGATFTDFINQYNSLLDRVERLEKIINKDR